MITQAAAIFLQNCNSHDNTIREQARKNLQRCANLYKRDDIVNSTKNAIALNELVNQLSNEEKNNEKTTVIEQGTTGSDIHNDIFSEQQNQQSFFNDSLLSPELNFDHLMLYNIL